MAVNKNPPTPPEGWEPNYEGEVYKPQGGPLWREQPDVAEGKYLVKRRDGSVPEWPCFVLGGRDLCAAYALRCYADMARSLGWDKAYCDSLVRLANDFDQYRHEHGNGDPTAGRHRVDDYDTVMEMRKGHCA